jgi:hypothetical protein
MTIRLSLAAALLGAVALASPAFAIEQVHIPDASAAQNSAPPDALFDKSVPTTWQQKQDLQQQQSNGVGLSNFHFSAGAGNNPYSSEQHQYTTGFQGENAGQPGSEFHTNGVPLDPYYAPPPR